MCSLQPSQRSSHGLSVIGDTAYVFGGEHVARTPIDSHVHCFDLNARTWAVAEASGAVPPPRIAHSQAAVGTTIYVFGGRQSVTMEEKPLNDLHSFDVATGAWAQVAPADASGAVPAVRSFHKMAAVGSTLYVFGVRAPLCSHIRQPPTTRAPHTPQDCVHTSVPWQARCHLRFALQRGVTKQQCHG